MTQDVSGGQSKVQVKIVKACDSIKKLLLEKNAKYGNSALEPMRVFSNSSSIEQIKVRIDDKLSRIQNMRDKIMTTSDDEDTVKDLIGYLILLMVANDQQEDEDHWEDGSPFIPFYSENFYDDILQYEKDEPDAFAACEFSDESEDILKFPTDKVVPDGYANLYSFGSKES